MTDFAFFMSARRYGWRWSQTAQCHVRVELGITTYDLDTGKRLDFEEAIR